MLSCLDGTTGPCSRLRASIAQVIAQPALFDGRRVSIKGYFSADFEGTGIHASSEDYEWLSGSAIFIEVSEDRRAKLAHLDQTWVVVTGTYSATLAEGHVGRLRDVESIDAAWSRSRQPVNSVR